MFDHPGQRRQLLATFQTEHTERVSALEQLVASLDIPSSPLAHAGVLATLVRETHSLKGAARAVEREHIERWAHAFEGALLEAGRSGTAPSPQWIDAAHTVVSTLAQLADAGSGTPLSLFPEILMPPVDAPQSRVATAPQSTPPKADTSGGIEQPADESAPAQARSQPTADSVRVSVGKLDTLLAHAGELAVTYIRVAQRLAELRDVRDSFTGMRREWRRCRSLRADIRRKLATDQHAARTLTRDVEALLLLTEHAEERSLAMSRQIEDLASRLHQDAAQLAIVSQGMETDVLAIRLLPVATVLVPLQRVVRDLARTQNKAIRLLLEGQDIEIDRTILEQLRDPLLHMVRNSIDHGIESPDVRQVRGKPREGTIRLSVAQRGNAIEILISDDGAGMDPERMRQIAVSKGFLSDERARTLDDQSAIEMIFRAGFSTTTTATEISGRGVGMDVAREHLDRLGGTITPWSVPGQGTRFTIRVPLTLATTRAIIVEQSGGLYAIPSALIERTSRVQEGQIISVDSRRTVAVEGHPVTVVELCDVLELPAVDRGTDATGWRSYFVLRQDEGRVALIADQLVGEQEIVVKRLAWPLHRVRNVGGAAVLGSGQIIAILNPSDLLKTALRIGDVHGRRPLVEVPASTAVPRQRCVLVVDDSLPTRTLERSILETAGYRTLAAGGGVDALRILRSEWVDLVVSDVEMPGLDGFGLTTEIRRDEKLRQIPIVLVTSLAAPEHRERGAAAGADAYILKGKFDQGQLLDTVGRLIA